MNILMLHKMLNNSILRNILIFCFMLFLFFLNEYSYAQKKIYELNGQKSSFEFFKKVSPNPRVGISIFDQRSNKRVKEIYKDIDNSLFNIFNSTFSSYAGINDVIKVLGYSLDSGTYHM